MALDSRDTDTMFSFLYEEIGKIMGLNTEHRIIIIGAGNLGQALANYVKFEKLGFCHNSAF